MDACERFQWTLNPRATPGAAYGAAQAAVLDGAGLARALGADLPLHLAAGTPLLIVAGLLVGFGTQLGNGCTSGHGVCGISRGSRRSIAATVTFMAVAAAVVFVVRHVGGAAT